MLNVIDAAQDNINGFNHRKIETISILFVVFMLVLVALLKANVIKFKPYTGQFN